MTTTAVSLIGSGGDTTTTTSGDANADSGDGECGRSSGGTEHAIQTKDHPEMNQNCCDDSKEHSMCHLVEYICIEYIESICIYLFGGCNDVDINDHRNKSRYIKQEYRYDKGVPVRQLKMSDDRLLLDAQRIQKKRDSK